MAMAFSEERGKKERREGGGGSSCQRAEVLLLLLYLYSQSCPSMLSNVIFGLVAVR